MKTVWTLLILALVTTTLDQHQRKLPEEHWKSEEPGRLQDSSRWSKRSADHRNAWKNDWHPEGVREGERDRPARLQGASVWPAASRGLRCAPTTGYSRSNPPGCNTNIGGRRCAESYVIVAGGQNSSPDDTQAVKSETSYDSSKDRTTVRLTPVQISSEQDKYHSLHMSPSFSFPGRQRVTPAIVDFELQSVVKGRLSTDLYVVFIIDGETVFLSSNRWAIKRPVPGRVWMGERLVFRMPYETFVKITNAKEFQIKFDRIKFSVGETQKQALRELLNYMKSAG